MHKGVSPLASMSLERVHFFCSNECVNPDNRSVVSSDTADASNIIAFASLRLPRSMAKRSKVLIEYEHVPGARSFHEVSLTCTAEGAGGLIYFGGYSRGRFSIFRADCIHRVVGV